MIRLLSALLLWASAAHTGPFADATALCTAVATGEAAAYERLETGAETVFFDRDARVVVTMAGTDQFLCAVEAIPDSLLPQMAQVVARFGLDLPALWHAVPVPPGVDDEIAEMTAVLRADPAYVEETGRDARYGALFTRCDAARLEMIDLRPGTYLNPQWRLLRMDPFPDHMRHMLAACPSG
ncbi:MAG: hypothetical protein AAGF60_06320 [Pseudomonadota bacterium]